MLISIVKHIYVKRICLVPIPIQHPYMVQGLFMFAMSGS